MNIRKVCLLLCLACITLPLTGCFDAEVDEQNVPWGRPADWEGGAPGFGPGGYRR